MSLPDPEDSTSRLSKATGEFAELVAAGTPTPGGGSVAAYSGALAAALGRMMCNLTIGKAKYAQAEPRLKEINARLERLGSRLGELIAEDAASFDDVLKAYRLPKETEEQKAERQRHIEAAGRGAINVPFETTRRALEVLKLLAELIKIGNPNAFSDVAVGAQLAQTAVRGAYYNVAVNLNMLSDSEAADQLRRQVTSMKDEAEKLAAQIESAVTANF